MEAAPGQPLQVSRLPCTSACLVALCWHAGGSLQQGGTSLFEGPRRHAPASHRCLGAHREVDCVLLPDGTPSNFADLLARLQHVHVLVSWLGGAGSKWCAVAILFRMPGVGG